MPHWSSNRLARYGYAPDPHFDPLTIGCKFCSRTPRNRSPDPLNCWPTPADKLTTVEIAVAGCPCKGCSYAANRMLTAVAGVERATADFKAGKVTALFDPTVCDRAKLEEALKKGGVELPPAK